jgi:hypothetical protein
MRLQAAHHLREAVTFLRAEQGSGGDTEVVEGELAAFDAFVAELGQIPRHGEAGAFLDQQDTDPLMRGLRRRVGLAQQGDQPRVAGVTDPCFGAVHDVVVAVAASDSAHRLQVGAASGFGQRHRGPDLAGGHLGEIAVLLLIGAVGKQEFGDDGVPSHGTGKAHPASGELFGD